MTKIPMDRKTMLLVAGVVAAIAVFMVLVAPLQGKIRDAKREAGALEEELASVRDALKLKDPSRQAGALLTLRELSLAIDEITRTGTVRRINFQAINPQKITKPQGSKYPVLPISMVLQSEYKDMGQFLHALEGLKRSIVGVRDFEIEADPQEKGKVITKLTVMLYLQEGEDG